MDYENVVDSLKELKNHLDDVFDKPKGRKKEKAVEKKVSEEKKENIRKRALEAEKEIPAEDGDQEEEKT